MRELGTRRIGSLEELAEVTSHFAMILRPGTTIGLTGELGAGKTEFVRHLLRSYGVLETVSSPTFVLETQYEIAPKPAAKENQTTMLYHWDLYRLAQDEIPEDLMDRIRDEQALLCVEWPEKIPDVLDQLDIHLVLSIGEQADSSVTSEQFEAPTTRQLRIASRDSFEINRDELRKRLSLTPKSEA